MRPSSLLNHKAFQLYVVAMFVVFFYLHFRYGWSRSRERTLEASELSSSYSRFAVAPDARSSDPPPRRFILGLNYWEQFTMATGNLLSLVCLGEQWNATTVQPFTFNSRLYGLQNFKPGMYGEWVSSRRCGVSLRYFYQYVLSVTVCFECYGRGLCVLMHCWTAIEYLWYNWGLIASCMPKINFS